VNDHRVISGISTSSATGSSGRIRGPLSGARVSKSATSTRTDGASLPCFHWWYRASFANLKTARWKPPFIEVGHADQHPLLLGRLHVPGRRRKQWQLTTFPA
jgi:hypothetical protein